MCLCVQKHTRIICCCQKCPLYFHSKNFFYFLSKAGLSPSPPGCSRYLFINGQCCLTSAGCYYQLLSVSACTQRWKMGPAKMDGSCQCWPTSAAVTSKNFITAWDGLFPCSSTFIPLCLCVRVCVCRRENLHSGKNIASTNRWSIKVSEKQEEYSKDNVLE